MSTADLVTCLLAIAISGILLAILGWHDPKRVRSQAHTNPARIRKQRLPALLRRLCAGMVLVPGIVLAGLGQWWPFVTWLGTVCAFGWITAQFLALSSAEPQDV